MNFKKLFLNIIVVSAYFTGFQMASNQFRMIKHPWNGVTLVPKNEPSNYPQAVRQQPVRPISQQQMAYPQPQNLNNFMPQQSPQSPVAYNNSRNNMNLIDAISTQNIDLVKAALNNSKYSLNNSNILNQSYMNSKTLESVFPIHQAAIATTDPNILSLLLQIGADVNQLSESGKTPLFYALKYNSDPKIANFLIARGARLDVVDNFGNNLFHALMNSPLSINDQKRFITQLLNAEVDPAEPNNAGVKPYLSETLNRAIIEETNDLVNADMADDLFNAEIAEPTQNSRTKKLLNEDRTEPAQALTDEDTCVVCLEPVQNIETNVYKTNCCKQFLCQNCAQSIQESAQEKFNQGLPSDVTLKSLISCPTCRTKPLTLNEFDKNTLTTVFSNQITLPHNFQN